MTNIDAASGAAPPAPPRCQNPTVDLEVPSNLLTIKHDRNNRLRIVITPQTCRATAYKIEIKRASGGGWFTLSTRRNYLWSARVAGKFKLRGTATIEGSDVQSGEKDVEVQFPNYAQIVGDSRVRTLTNREWRSTLRECTRRRRRERGFWIQVNTKTNRYFASNRSTGNWVGPAAGASVNLPGRPADVPASPDPNAKSVKYPVASFHTHTPTTFRPNPPPPAAPSVRPVGPSTADNNADNTDQVPGVVYDFVESPAGSGSIPMRHPKNSAATLYRSLGVDRRPTP
jgi:hypothetical protein